MHGFPDLVGVLPMYVAWFKFLQIYRYPQSLLGHPSDRLNNQKLHFIAWGKSCGFDLDEHDLEEGSVEA
jgi:hypothetical protein